MMRGVGGVDNSILVTDYLTKMGIKTVPQPPYSPDLAPSDFCLFSKLRGCLYETIEEMKEAVTLARSHKRTSMGPSGSCWNGTTSAWQPEITLKGTRVSCVYSQIECPYEKGLETYRMYLVFKLVAIFLASLLMFFLPNKSVLFYAL